MKTVFDKLRSLVCGKYHFAARDILPQTTLESVGFANHNKLELFLDVEQRFEIQLCDDTIEPIKTFDQLSVLIEQLRFQAVEESQEVAYN